MLKQEILEHYKDVVGVITIDRDPGYYTTQNGLMHLGFFLCLLHELNQIETTDLDNFVHVVFALEDKPGLFNRYPDIKDKDSYDNARGAVAASYLLNTIFHHEVLLYGLQHFFYYDNTDGKEPGLWAWRGRFIIDIIYYFSVYNKVLLYICSPLLLSVLFIKSLFKTVNYGVILDSMIIFSLAKNNYVWKKFKNYYLKKVKLVESVIDYFHEFHPIVDLTKQVLDKTI